MSYYCLINYYKEAQSLRIINNDILDCAYFEKSFQKICQSMFPILQYWVTSIEMWKPKSRLEILRITTKSALSFFKCFQISTRIDWRYSSVAQYMPGKFEVFCSIPRIKTKPKANSTRDKTVLQSSTHILWVLREIYILWHKHIISSIGIFILYSECQRL